MTGDAVIALESLAVTTRYIDFFDEVQVKAEGTIRNISTENLSRIEVLITIWDSTTSTALETIPGWPILGDYDSPPLPSGSGTTFQGEIYLPSSYRDRTGDLSFTVIIEIDGTAVDFEDRREPNQSDRLVGTWHLTGTNFDLVADQIRTNVEAVTGEPLDPLLEFALQFLAELLAEFVTAGTRFVFEDGGIFLQKFQGEDVARATWSQTGDTVVLTGVDEDGATVVENLKFSIEGNRLTLSGFSDYEVSSDDSDPEVQEALKDVPDTELYFTKE